jgi:siderophore synthetase component
MSEQSAALAYRTQHHQDLAGAHSIAALLNCYCREVAAPAGQLQLDTPFGQKGWPLALKHSQRVQHGHILEIQLPVTRARILVAVARPSTTLNYDYIGAPYGGDFGKPWQALDWRRLAQLLLAELAGRYDQPVNTELLAQIGNSVQVMGAFIELADRGHDWGQGAAAYLRSEQALTFGHACHPTPKSRQGISLEAIRQYSPEVGAAFQLHYFAVRAQDLKQRSLLTAPGIELLAGQLPGIVVPAGYWLIPVHPWQADHIRALASVQAALNSGRLKDLGPAGELWYPTASVRTLYRPGADFFLKCSLHVRLTNCVRKNAWYELEGAVGLSQLLQRHAGALTEAFPSLTLMAEPAFVTVDFQDQGQAQRIELQEAFGLIMRSSPHWSQDEAPLLAGALFGDSLSGKVQCRHQVEQRARRHGLSYGEAALQWFVAYVEQLAHPMLYALCQLGVVFEPHLQNVMVGLQDGLPARLYIRDLEGTKLVTGYWPQERLAQLPQRVRQSVEYSAEQGWQRVAYCLFINNFSQAVFYLAAGSRELETALWRGLAQSLEDYQRRHGNACSGELIARVLQGEPWPNKTNLLNRVLQRADRFSEYVPLPSPLKNL